MKATALMTLLSIGWVILSGESLWGHYQFIKNMEASGFEKKWGYGLEYIIFYVALVIASIWAIFGKVFRKTPVGVLIALFMCGILIRLLTTVGGYDVPITNTQSILDIVYLVCGGISIYALATEYT